MRERLNYEEANRYAVSQGGRLLRESEIESLLAKVNAPLCPYKEMWVATAFEKWIHVGSYCASLKFKVGTKLNKNNTEQYDECCRWPNGELGQLYLIDANEDGQHFDDIDDFLSHFEEE